MPTTIKPTEKMQHPQDILGPIFTEEGEHLLSPCPAEDRGWVGSRGDRVSCVQAGLVWGDTTSALSCQHELPCLVPYKHTWGKKCF